ncbi:leucine-rich repeat-containing protein 20-like isoform X2 [Physella acuta]|nr:leucine-rich repeat-containing protein 20-like isoform X2 [Physella acuta]XP_059169012.1 leucine-rich repeat-containing protein 20-like isoform X2 [Physella acuta]XP_059169013.1 leucine-rich repeat-containing protein 20-like isoform X2 [Physella acuta]XP_059169014.1 leucine-rich repeat-containing protein 20-like isoform X2 [Physella acuta]
MTQIPDAVYFLMNHTEIESCILAQNLLKRIPAKFITNFPCLKELYINSNHLGTLPDEMLQFEVLETLDISQNEFTTLPSVVYKMGSLKTLNAEKNLITEVDIKELKNLPNILELNFQENPLLPSMLSELKCFPENIKVFLTVGPNV